MADQPQTSLERMQANVAQIAQQRRQDAQMRNQAALAFETEIAQNLADSESRKKDEAISDAILAAQRGSTRPAQPKEPAPGMIDNIADIVGGFAPSKPTRSKEERKADRAAKKEAKDTRRTRLAELAGKTTSASRALATFGSAGEVTDTGPTEGPGMAMRENPGRKLVAK